MCICIYKTKNGRISKERLEQAYIANPDGWGLLTLYNNIFLYDKRLSEFWSNDITSSKIMNTFLWNYSFLSSFDADILIHFRTASAAGIGEKYCHPHFVNEDLAFVHNGNFFEFSSYFKGRKKDNKTDTIRFNEEVLQRLPDNFLDNKVIFNALNDYCKNNLSKMIFMNNKGKVWIVNEEAGEWKDGCWYSNGGIDNYQGYGYSGAYEYNKGDIRHKGGLPTVQFIDKDRRKHWNRCSVCGGWYKQIFYVKNICDSCLKLKRLKEYCI